MSLEPATSDTTATGGLRLRGRLMLGAVLVGVPPLLILSLVFHLLTKRRFEERAAVRLELALETSRVEINALGDRAAPLLDAIVAEDLPAAPPAAEAGPDLASRFAEVRGMDALEIVDADDRVISSHHWPAGFGLPDSDQLFAPEPSVRVEKVADGYGVTERLALMVSRSGVLWDQPVTVRGGSFIDSAFLERLSTLMGTTVGLYDGVRRDWTTAPESAFVEWTSPDFGSQPGSGVVALAGDTAATYQWTAAPLRPALWLVVGTTRTELDAVTRELRQITLVIAALALVICLTTGWVLSERIARPVRDLSRGAQRVARGDLSGTVPARGVGEVGDLARAFGSMTARLRASRARLIQAERVAAWREMARRLAHELKNPLFPIQVSIETLARAFERDRGREARGGEGSEGFVDLFRESTRTILDELASLRKIVDEFGAFARLPRPRLEPCQLGDVVERVLALYQPRCRAIRIERDLAPELPDVPLDAELMSRALGNLVVNAIEAMADSGTLAVRTRWAGESVTVSVSDTGPGLSDEQTARLFNPYFTTKEGGTGLGLAIVEGIVSDHGGRIEWVSRPGEGATFTIVLPTEAKATAAAEL